MENVPASSGSLSEPEPKGTTEFFYGWIIIGTGLLIGIIGIGSRYSFGVFLTSFEASFAMSRALASGIFSLYMLLCCAISALAGWAMDKYGPRKAGFVMGTVTAFSLLSTSLTTEAWQLFITYSFLFSLGSAGIYTLVNTTSSRWFVRKRGFVVGITSSGGGLGAIVVAPLATLLISNYGWRMAFVILGIVTWFLMAVPSLLLKRDPQEMGLFPDGDKSPLPRLEPSGGRPQSLREELTVRKALHMSQFWSISCIWILLSLSLHMVFVHLVPYAVSKGISPMDAAFVLSIIGLTNIIGRLVIGRLSDFIDRKTLGTVCALIQFGSFLWLLIAGDLLKLYGFAIVFGFLWGGTGIIVTTLIGDTFGVESLGTIMGLVNSGWSLGAATGPLIGGLLFDLTGHYLAAFAAGAASILAAAVVFALMSRHTPLR